MGVEVDEHAGDLIRRIAGGDRRAFERLYERYAQLVLNVAARILRNSEDAEEVVQEVFWQAWCSAGRYDPVRGVPEAWLMTLARTRAIDLMRASRRTATAGAEALADIPADPGFERSTGLPSGWSRRPCKNSPWSSGRHSSSPTMKG